jgi:hypothetical protein
MINNIPHLDPTQIQQLQTALRESDAPEEAIRELPRAQEDGPRGIERWLGRWEDRIGTSILSAAVEAIIGVAGG